METNFTLLEKHKNLKFNLNSCEYFEILNCDNYFELVFYSKKDCDHKIGCRCKFRITSDNDNKTEYREIPDYFYPHNYCLNFDQTYYIYFYDKKVLTLSPTKQWNIKYSDSIEMEYDSDSD